MYSQNECIHRPDNFRPVCCCLKYLLSILFRHQFTCNTMSNIPRDQNFDSSFALLYDGYTFIQERCRRFNSDIFLTRIMGEVAVCISGAEAARQFYDTHKFRREDAIPSRIKKTLFGDGGVQTLDGEDHRYRKEMFMSLMTPQSIRMFMDTLSRKWENCISRWEMTERVVLFDEVQELLCRAACDWTGVPLTDDEAGEKAKDLWAMVDAFGAIGPRHWRGRRARKRTGQWIGEFIKKVRWGELEIAKDAPAYIIARHRQRNERLLPGTVAAVELINLIRPIVAISTYIVFSALALHRYPEYRNRLLNHTDDFTDLFIQEVRRYFPFAPFLGARVHSPFSWRGYNFDTGRLVLLDVYGTNHDPKLWKDPDTFNPERFREWEGSLYSFIPQGGNNHDEGHRCAGEWITIETMKVALDFLTRYMEYDVPGQDLDFSLSRMPTYPRSGFIISGVRSRVHEK